jgi:hypothetical protein
MTAQSITPSRPASSNPTFRAAFLIADIGEAPQLEAIRLRNYAELGEEPLPTSRESKKS